MKSGEAKNRRPRTAAPGKRDRMILDDVVRYRLITNEWLLAQYLEGAKPNAAVKISGRLTREGWLTAHALFQRKQYYTAGPRLIRQRGLSMGRTRPLGTQALAVHYSVLRYCSVREAVGEATRDVSVATIDELRNQLPWLPARLHSRPHVFGGDGESRTWRMVRIDLGGRPDHVARKTAADLTLLVTQPEFARYAGEGRFVQVVLSASRGKKRLIEQAFSDRPWPRGVRFQIGVIPELFQLIATQ